LLRYYLDIKMTTNSEIEQILSLIEDLKQQVPDHLVQRLQQHESELKTIIAWVKIKHILDAEAQKSQSLHPALEQIKNIIDNASIPSSNMRNFPTNIKPTQDETVESHKKSENEVSNSVFQAEKTVTKKPTQPKVEAIEQLDEIRLYCWNLACCTNSSDFNAIERKTAPTSEPQTGDIVLHGMTNLDAAPFWIAPINVIPESALLFKALNFINPEGQIWLDFADMHEPTLFHQEAPIPDWLQLAEHAELMPLWQCWIDLLYWTLMAPDYEMLSKPQKPQTLAHDRKSIINDVLSIHRDFFKGFDNPERYREYLGYNLHKLYSVFHQFLCAKEMCFNNKENNPFTHLRLCADSNVNLWQKHLSIREEHAAGALNLKNKNNQEFFAAVTKFTDNNIRLPPTHSFSQTLKADKNQVLYWTKPHWYQNELESTHPYFELKGSVLYCYE